MSEAAGYLFYVMPNRVAIFEDALEEGSQFAEPVPEFHHSRSAALVCFICTELFEVSHFSRGRRGVPAGTEMRRLNMEDIQLLSRPLSLEDIISRVAARFRPRIRSLAHGGGPLPPATFRAFAEAVCQLDPSSAAALGRYSEVERERLARLSPQEQTSLALQKDAIGTALDIAGIDREALTSWRLRTGAPETFLEGLPEAYLREDQMIVNDFETLPGFDRIRSYVHGVAKFDGPTSSVKVILANRTNLETQLGVDLIYYNATYSAFILVQYKAMERLQTGDAVFRLPDPLLNRELARMEDALRGLPSAAAAVNKDAYRLSTEPFFLKFCPRVVFSPDDAALVPGMYFSFDHWKLVGSDVSTVTANGARALTNNNGGRHISNSFFSELVGNGWVGTSPSQSLFLRDFVERSMEAGKAVLYAVGSRVDANRSLTGRPPRRTRNRH
jgi:hypothetical protein